MTEPDTADPAALIAEANPTEDSSATVTVDHDGITFSVESNAELWSMDVAEAFEDGKVITALRGIVGPKQWAAFKATKPNTKQMGALFDAIAQACGLTSAGDS